MVMGSIADWAAVVVAFAAMLVAIVSVQVARRTTRQQLDHAHRMAMMDAKRRAYTEALAYWSEFVVPKQGSDRLRALERGMVVSASLDLVAAPVEIRKLALAANEINMHVALRTEYCTVAMGDLSTVTRLLRRCMVQDLDGGKIDSGLTEAALVAAETYGPGAYSEHLKRTPIPKHSKRGVAREA